jgi:hypothetical protein
MPALEDAMRKSKSPDLRSIHDKQYDATLLIVKLMASMSVEIKNLSSEVKQQNSLIKDLLSGSNLEEETV